MIGIICIPEQSALRLLLLLLSSSSSLLYFLLVVAVGHRLQMRLFGLSW